MDAADPNVQDIVELCVSDVVYPGRGLARLNDFVVFVPGVIAGERVRARITTRRPHFAEASLLEILEPSPARIAPECPLALTAHPDPAAPPPACPGCCYQQMRYEEELRTKDAQLTNLIERLGGGPPEGMHVAPVAAPDPYHYRNKIVLHVSAQEATRSIGYVGDDRQTIIPVADCPLARPELNERLHQLLEDPAFLEGLVDEDNVTLRFTEPDGALHWTGRRPGGNRWLTESTALGDIRVPAAGFFQVHSAMANRLLEAVREHIRQVQPTAVIDLYCGAGVFSIAAAEAGATAVLGIDVDVDAIKAARQNTRSRGLGAVKFVAAPAAETLDEALSPVPAATTLLIADPPRRGLEKHVARTLARHGPAHLLYISCAPDTLARDLKILREGGYRIDSRGVFDMFPRTAHFESLVALSRLSA